MNSWLSSVLWPWEPTCLGVGVGGGQDIDLGTPGTFEVDFVVCS